MHHFADASSTGYAACSYLRFHDEHDAVHVVFMVGKCRVVPFKPVLTIPRLELVAAVLSVQLATKLRKELPSKQLLARFFLHEAHSHSSSIWRQLMHADAAPSKARAINER